MIISTDVLNKLQWACNLHPGNGSHCKSRKTGKVVPVHKLDNQLPCVELVFEDDELDIVVVQYNSVIDEAMISSNNAETSTEVFSLLA